jgi:hypothetical protein
MGNQGVDCVQKVKKPVVLFFSKKKLNRQDNTRQNKFFNVSHGLVVRTYCTSYLSKQLHRGVVNKY